MLKPTGVSLRGVFGLAVALIVIVDRADARSCVWKVTSASGETLYLGGSWHALRSRDYPLPPAFPKAFDASSHLAFEISPNDLHNPEKHWKSPGHIPAAIV